MEIQDIEKIEADIEHAVKRERAAVDAARRKIAHYNELCAQAGAVGGSTPSELPEELESLLATATAALVRARRAQFAAVQHTTIQPGLSRRWGTFAPAYRAAVREADGLRAIHRAAQRLATVNHSMIAPLDLPEDQCSERLLAGWTVGSGQPPIPAGRVRPGPLSLGEILRRVLGAT